MSQTVQAEDPGTLLQRELLYGRMFEVLEKEAGIVPPTHELAEKLAHIGTSLLAEYEHQLAVRQNGVVGLIDKAASAMGYKQQRPAQPENALPSGPAEDAAVKAARALPGVDAALKALHASR